MSLQLRCGSHRYTPNITASALRPFVIGFPNYCGTYFGVMTFEFAPRGNNVSFKPLEYHLGSLHFIARAPLSRSSHKYRWIAPSLYQSLVSDLPRNKNPTRCRTITLIITFIMLCACIGLCDLQFMLASVLHSRLPMLGLPAVTSLESAVSPSLLSRTI